jgi:hypothetical protein
LILKELQVLAFFNVKLIFASVIMLVTGYFEVKLYLWTKAAFWGFYEVLLISTSFTKSGSAYKKISCSRRWGCLKVTQNIMLVCPWDGQSIH